MELIIPYRLSVSESGFRIRNSGGDADGLVEFMWWLLKEFDWLDRSFNPSIHTMFPYLKPIGESIELVRSKWTGGVSAGILVLTHLDTKSIIGIGVKYVYIPYPSGIVSLEGSSLKRFRSITLFLIGGS